MIKKQSGFTLIEVLCALAISLVCLSVLIQIFIHYEKSFSQSKAYAEVQENIRFSSYILKNRIEQAGLDLNHHLAKNFQIHQAGATLLNTFNLNNSLTVYQGSSHQWQPRIPSYIHIKPKKDTDIIVIRNASPLMSHLKFPVGHAKEFFVSLDAKFKNNDDIMIVDIEKAMLLHVSKVYRSLKHRYQRLVTTNMITENFDVHADVSKVKTSIFFIRSTNRFDAFGHKIDALYLLDESGRQAELIPNVKEMKVICFERNDLGFLRQKQVSEVLQWQHVQFVQINLLLKSSYYAFETQKKYWFNSAWHEPNNHYLYQEIKFLIPIVSRVKK